MLLKEVRVLFRLQSRIPLCKCTTVFFVCSSTEGHLGCFQIVATVNNTAVNTEVHVFFQVSVSGVLGYVPSSGIAGT